ncbi:MAG TPA: dTMP kinase [Candidatus Altiarchaeales archaeon]|nr:dTMP kinase [Candidatus Altiarchaeales archaeon]
MFIVLEGIDGCGKSTHAKDLGKWLGEKGFDVVLTAEPTNSKTGMWIREVLGGKATADPETLALLFTADRSQHVKSLILPALDSEKIVVCERYYYSTIAYQAAQGVSWSWLVKINEFAPKPDLTILLDIPLDAAVSRYSGDEIFEKREFLAKVRENYYKFGDMVSVDSGRSFGETREKIREIVWEKIK